MPQTTPTRKVQPVHFQSTQSAQQLQIRRLRPAVKFKFAKQPKQQLGSGTVATRNGGRVDLVGVRQPGNFCSIKPLPETGQQRGGGWACRTQKWAGEVVNAEGIYLNPNYVRMYPGAVYDYAAIADGSYRTLPYARKPMMINVEGTKFTKPLVRVEKPSSGTVQQAIASIKNSQRNEGGTRGAGTRFEVLAEEDLFLRTSGSGHFLGIGGSFDFQTSQKERTHRYFLEIVQTYYTVSVDDSVNEPTDFFVLKSEQPTNDDAVAEGLVDPNWVFVDTVTYGRVLQVMLEADDSFASLGIDVEAHANFLIAGGEGSTGVQQKSALEKVRVTLRHVGGKANLAANVLTAKDLPKAIEAYFAGTGDEEPIAYSLRTLDQMSVGAHLTTEFTSRQCAPLAGQYKVTWKDVLCVRNDDSGDAEEIKAYLRIRGIGADGNNVLDVGRINKPLLDWDELKRKVPSAPVPAPWTFTFGSEAHPLELHQGERRDMSSKSITFPLQGDAHNARIAIRADVLEFDDTSANDDFADEAKTYTIDDIGPGRTVTLLCTHEDSRIQFTLSIEPVYA